MIISVITQERQAALAAVAAQLWHIGVATDIRRQQAVPDIPSSSCSQGSPILADPPAAAASGTVATPVNAGTQSSTLSCTGNAAIPVKQDEDKSSGHHMSHSQASARLRDHSPATVAPVGQQGQSERESRAAARTSRLAQASGIGSSEGRLTQPSAPKGNSEGQVGQHEGQTQAPPSIQIPQSDGPAAGDDTEDEAEGLSGDGAVMARFDAQLQSPPSPPVDITSTAAARSSATLTQPQNVRQAQAAQAALLAAVPELPAPGQAALGCFPMATDTQPASSSLRSLGNLSALEQMARYLPSSSAMPAPPASPAGSSVAAQPAVGCLPPAAVNISAAAAARPATADQQAQPSRQGATDNADDSMPEQPLGQHAQHAQRAQHAQQTVVAQQLATAALPVQQADAQGLHQPAYGGNVEGPTQQPMAQELQIVCPCSGRKYHFGCLPKADQAQVCQGFQPAQISLSCPDH